MIKTILQSSYNYTDAKTASIIDIVKNKIDKAWFKKAGLTCGAFKDLEITPKKGCSYIHLIAMGATEYWSQNRNGDAFLEKSAEVSFPYPKNASVAKAKIAHGLIDTYMTFEKYAHVFREHNHHDITKKEGDVYKAAYSPEMHRVELIIEVPTDKWSNELEKLARGEDVGFSMSCKVPYDICRICGNKAQTRLQYCDHAREHMSEILKSGHVVGVYNDHMKFFDISLVRTPADRIAYGLYKVASSSKIVSGAELADIFGIKDPTDILSGLEDAPCSDKHATLAKLADIEKYIEGIASGDSELNKLLCGIPNIEVPEDIMDMFMTRPRSEIPSLLSALADAKICLPLKDFIKLIVGRERFKEVEPHIPKAYKMLPGIFTRLFNSPSLLDSTPECELNDNPIPTKLRVKIITLKPRLGLDDEDVRSRAVLCTIKGSGGPVFYSRDDLENKEASSNSTGAVLARVYAAYKLAVCQKVNDDLFNKLIVITNYVKK